MTQQSKIGESEGNEMGIECDVESCDEMIVALDDGWEFDRGTVCSGCIEYNDRHHHWPDEEPEHCRECILDDGGMVHDCPETTIDVLLRPGDSCSRCGFELAVTDGGAAPGDSDDESHSIPEKHNRNGWKKYHAEHDCGGETVWFIENPWRTDGPWQLYCAKCGRGVAEEEVLFINDSWYYEFEEEHGMMRLFDKLHLSPDRVLEIGPDPDGEELIDAIAAQKEENDRVKREHRERMKESGAPAYQENEG